MEFDYESKHLRREIDRLRDDVERFRKERDQIWEECREAVVLNRELKRVLKAIMESE